MNTARQISAAGPGAWLGWGLAMVVTALAGVPAAWAQARAEPTVAVLPLSSPDRSMRIYGPPVAQAVAKHLREQTRLQVDAPSLKGSIPISVGLVVDGRIVSEPSGKVRLEARLRDPERGRTVAVVGTDARALADIDRLALELASALAPKLRQAAASEARPTSAAKRPQPAQAGAPTAPASEPAAAPSSPAPAPAADANANRPTAPARSPEMAAQPANPASANPAPADSTPADPASADPASADPASADPASASSASATPGATPAAVPPLALFGPVGQVASGQVPFVPEAMRMGRSLAQRLGYRAQAVEETGRVGPKPRIAALGRVGAEYGLAIEVRAIEFAWHGVLTARGEIKVDLIDANGSRFYSRIMRTGTLVGSRGDRHAALVRYVLEQAVDVFVPDLRRALALRQSRTPAAARKR